MDSNLQSESDGEEQSQNDEAIGVYYVPTSELEKQPENRTYQRKALWTPDGWAETSDGETIEDAPDERSLDAFRNRWGRSRNYFVMRPDEVPGEAEVQDPAFSPDELGLDVEYRED